MMNSAIVDTTTALLALALCHLSRLAFGIELAFKDLMAFCRPVVSSQIEGNFRLQHPNPKPFSAVETVTYACLISSPFKTNSIGAIIEFGSASFTTLSPKPFAYNLTETTSPN